MSSEVRNSFHIPTVAVSIAGAALVGILFYLRGQGIALPWLLTIAVVFSAVAFFIIRQAGGVNGVANPKDFYTGVLLLAVCGVFAAGMFGLPLGWGARPRPRFFPLMLLGLLFVFSLIILMNGLRTKGEPLGAVPWRGLIIVTGMTVFFGATIKGLGFVPAIFTTAFVSCMASQKWSLTSALVTAVVLTVFSWLIFIWGLGLPIALCGSWLRIALTSMGIAGESIPYCY